MREQRLRTIAYATVSLIGGGAVLFLFFKNLFYQKQDGHTYCSVVKRTRARVRKPEFEI